MKKGWLISLSVLLFFCSSANAQNMYIKDDLKVTFRTGPAIDNKILRMIATGDRVAVLESDNKWSRVRLDDGSEGWVLDRWLTADTPKKILLEALQKKHEALLLQSKDLVALKKRYDSELKTLKADLARSRKEAKKYNTAYDTLKKRSANYLQLEADYKETTGKLDVLSNNADMLNDKLTQKNITWFLSGAGVLLMGIIIGFTSKRKRRSSLY